MPTLQKVLIALFVAVLLAGSALSDPEPTPSPEVRPNQLTVRVASTTVLARLVQTPEETAKGLGGVSTLGENEGMLFLFTPNYSGSFWNGGMLIPFDLLWIKEGSVISIEKQVPPEAGGTVYLKAPEPVNYVLEVNGGWSEKNGIKIGDTVSLLPLSQGPKQ